MPSFVGRLSKHSNRSQPAIAEQQPASGAGNSGGPGLLLADSPAEANPPAPSHTAFSSSESFADALQTLASQPPPPPQLSIPQLPGPGSDHSPLLTPLVAAEGSSPALNGRKRFHTPLEQQRSPPPPLLHLASQRQQHDVASLDQASSPDAFQQPPPATGGPEKRSTRKLIKGIFSGSGRASNDAPYQPKSSPTHGHHSSYDNTAGLARRSSKRVSLFLSSLPAAPNGAAQVHAAAGRWRGTTPIHF